jgi:hypothetical protein
VTGGILLLLMVVVPSSDRGADGAQELDLVATALGAYLGD